MVGCSIRHCQSRSVKGGNIMFFSIPNKESVAKEWLRYCGPKTTVKHGRVCSKHFLDSDYYNYKFLRLNSIKEAPTRRARNLRRDAIPTLHIYNKDKPVATQTTEIGYIDKPEASHTLENNYTEPDPLQIDNIYAKNIPIVAIDIPCSSSDIKSFRGECNTKANKIYTKNIPIVAIDIPSETVCSSRDIKCLPGECSTKANKIEGSPDAIENRCINLENIVGDSNIAIPLAEHMQLQETAKMFNVLKKNLEKIFTVSQIRCLMKPGMRPVKWSDKDIASAISLRNIISPRAYHHLRENIGIPLPSFPTLRKWVSKFGHGENKSLNEKHNIS